MEGLFNHLLRIWQQRRRRAKTRRDDSPLETLQRHLGEMGQSAEALKQSSLKLGEMQGELRQRLRQLERLIQRYEEQARKAYKLKQMELAELAIREKLRNITERGRLQGDIDELGKQIAVLETRKEGLLNRLEIYQTKREELELRYSASQAELQAREINTGISESSLMLGEVKDALEEAEREIQAMQARVEATRELEQERTGQTPTEIGLDEEQQERLLPEEESAVSRELERIKHELS